MPRLLNSGTPTRRSISATYWPDTATLKTLNRVPLSRIPTGRLAELVVILLEALH